MGSERGRPLHSGGAVYPDSVLRLAVPRRLFVGLADEDLGDAGAVRFVYAKEVAVDADFVSLRRHAAQVAEYEAAYGLEVPALELGAQCLVDFSYRHASVRAVGAVAHLSDGGFFLVELVADLADDLLDYVFEGEYALERAPLVDDHDHLEILPPEVFEDVVYAAVLGDGEHVAHQVAGRLCRARCLGGDGAQDVLHVHGADYAVG